MITSESEARKFVTARCDDTAMARLDRMERLLRGENARQNLVSAATMAAVWQRHIADSAQLLDHVPRGTMSWLDLGTGAGFPGMVIAIMRPELAVTVVESRRLRIDWLQSLVESLKLENCQVAGQRVELVETQIFDVISARAFAPISKVIRLASRFSTSDTTWLLPKGRSAAQEVSELPAALREMFHVEQSATDADSGIVLGRIVEGQSR